jgi:predicted PolB exonuclease-like 3'-5' exonuclease
MNLIFDIETVPAQDPEHIAAIKAEAEAARDEALACVKAPANYKDADKIAAYIEAEKAKVIAGFDAEVQAAIAKTSFDGGLGQIVCIAWQIDEGQARSLQVEDLTAEAERALLVDWFAALRSAHSGSHGTRPVLIGHNVVGFDIPFVWKRAIVRSVKPPLWFPRNPKPWAESVFDTMTAWAGDRDRISMDKLCRILGIPGKGDISGADVWPMVQAGRLNEVAAYCRDDVQRTKAIHDRLTFAAAIKSGRDVPGAKLGDDTARLEIA